MPVLRVTKNEQHLCTVGSDDVWSFSASVWGDLWGPEVSHLDVSGGGKRRPGGDSDFLIWEMPHELVKGDRVRFFFEEGTVSSPKGTLFDSSSQPAQAPEFEMSSPPTDDEITKLETRPPRNGELTWVFTADQAPAISVAPDTTRQHVGLHILWNEERPERMRVHLSKSSLREIVNRSDGEKLFLEYVHQGSSFEVAIGL